MLNSVIERCDSTNDLARQLGEAGCPHGSWISARIQDKGRGRLGREWRSLEGNLFLSMVVRPQDKSLWTWIPLATALGMAEAITEVFPSLPVRVKWPNDLWIHEKKLGGILCEAVGSRENSFIVIGMGLNCKVAPEGLDQESTSLSAELGRSTNATVTADDIRVAIIRSVLRWMNMDREKIMATYDHAAAFTAGTKIQWADGKKTGTVIGLGSSGELRVHETGSGAVSLFAEDVKIKVFR
jgi:BirA family biotin operon repressor/biotin-[acetyl-CoA-carboxylase] ligase